MKSYALPAAKQFTKAIDAFTLNTEAFPESSNAFDSLREGYMNAGNNALAIGN